VVVLRNSNWEADHYGESYVDSNGHPTIELNSATGLTDANAAHELMHLLLKWEGFLGLEFDLPAGDNTPGNQEWLRWLSFHLRDPILHYVFYPRMRRMGIEPGKEAEKEFRDVVATGEMPRLNNASRFEALALNYLRAKVEITSPTLQKDIDALYEAK